MTLKLFTLFQTSQLPGQLSPSCIKKAELFYLSVTSKTCYRRSSIRTFSMTVWPTRNLQRCCCLINRHSFQEILRKTFSIGILSRAVVSLHPQIIQLLNCRILRCLLQIHPLRNVVFRM